MRWFRRRTMPPSVRAVELEPGERRIAWSLTTDGTPVVATDRRLVVGDGDFLRWHDVEHVTWRRPLLTLTEVTQVRGSGRNLTLTLVDDDGGLPDVVRSSVTSSVAWSTYLRLPGGGVRVVGRRQPGRDDLDWQLVYDQGTDLDDPMVRAQAEQALLDARRTIG